MFYTLLFFLVSNTCSRWVLSPINKIQPSLAFLQKREGTHLVFWWSLKFPSEKKKKWKKKKEARLRGSIKQRFPFYLSSFASQLIKKTKLYHFLLPHFKFFSNKTQNTKKHDSINAKRWHRRKREVSAGCRGLSTDSCLF